MKFARLLSLTAVAALSALTFAQSSNSQPHARYKLIELANLGGSGAGGNSINNFAWVTGAANEAGNETTHAALWVRGFAFDLGTLGGPNSGVEWPNHNNQGLIAGISETTTMDPNGENWSCSAFFPSVTHQQCLGTVWLINSKLKLPTLGGTNGYAAGANNLGQVVGWAENKVHDSTCNPPQVLQFRAVVWGPNLKNAQELPPLSDDPDSAATAINDKGQVVGISGICDNAVGEFSARHAVIWENGQPTNIGNFGGKAWNTPTAINNHGQVVGFSDFPGDDDGTSNFHAFLWTKDAGMQDLGVLPGDVRSQALGINEQGQIVGLSIDKDHNIRAFLWEKGVMHDLNRMVPKGSPFLLYANDINSAGQITGEVFDSVTGEAPAFLAVPQRDDSSDVSSEYARPTLPPEVRRRVMKHLALNGID